MFGDELAHLVDGTNAVQIALALRVAPSEQAVAAENQAFRAWIVLYRALQHKSKLKPGPLPWKQRDLSSELPVELFELCLPLELAASAIAQSGWRWST